MVEIEAVGIIEKEWMLVDGTGLEGTEIWMHGILRSQGSGNGSVMHSVDVELDAEELEVMDLGSPAIKLQF